MTALVVIAAVARNGVIGARGRLLWRLPEDLARFKRLTLGQPLLMGRKTFAAIGRALPGRASIVVTRDPAFRAPGVETALSIEAGLAAAQAQALAMGATQIALIGGGSLFSALLAQADALRLTEVDAAPHGDAFFPALDPRQWREIAREPHPRGPRDDCAYAFVDYERARTPD